ncbi:MAG: circadian clock KaiB family protein [Patescibacteria group bacterium]|nr:circadian clock KaiB family protein [Patescibacteria group bacterium]
MSNDSSLADEKIVLRLYITGATHHSMQAVRNIQKLCEEYLENSYDLDIIDVYQQPYLAKEKQIIAAPTLIKTQPYPVRRIVGDMSDTEKILTVLNVQKATK